MNLLEAFIGDRIDFVRFGTEHWIWIIVYGFISTWCLIHYARKQDEATQQKIGFYHGLFGVVVWFLLNFVIYGVKGMYLPALLPFHVCYMLNLILPFMHKNRSFLIFQIAYSWVMAGSLQGIFTPDLDQSFPHYYNIRYFVVHIGLVQSILYAIFVYGFRPKPSGILISLLVGDLYIMFVHLINLALGTNFVYTVSKPPKTMLDALGEHYLLEAQPLALLLFAIVYLPFLYGDVKRWKSGKVVSQK